MSEYDEIDNEIPVEDNEYVEENIKDLRKAHKILPKVRQEAEAAKAEAAQAQRELAFVKAGIDGDSKIGALLIKSYDGELSKEAITAYAQEVGYQGLAPTVNPQAEIAANAADRSVTIQSLMADPSGSAIPQQDPKEVFREVYQSLQLKGLNSDEAFSQAMRRAYPQS